MCRAPTFRAWIKKWISQEKRKKSMKWLVREKDKRITEQEPGLG